MYNNINISGRIFRVTLSISLILVVLNSDYPLGNMVYLPFAAIYAGITGFIGWDPINKLSSIVEEKARDKMNNTRQNTWLAQ